MFSDRRKLKLAAGLLVLFTRESGLVPVMRGVDSFWLRARPLSLQLPSMTHNPRTRLGLLSVVAAFLMACAPPSAEELLDDARQRVAKGDPTAAITQLKASLSANPTLAEARLLLGSLLLDAGDHQGALVELRRAQELQATPAVLIPVLARALLASRQFNKLVDEFGSVKLESRGATADLLGYLAAAQLELGHAEKAKEIAREALAAHAGSVPAIAISARFLALDGKFAPALALLQKGLTENPRNLGLLNQLASVQVKGLRDTSAAIATLQSAVAIDHRDVEARTNLLALLVLKRDFAAAKEHLAYFAKTRPSDPHTSFMSAVVAHAEGDNKRAMESILEVLKIVPDNPQVLLLAGTMYLEGNSLLAAARHLSKALAINPELDEARHRLAATYLRMGDAQKALSTLDPLLSGSGSGRALAMAGHAHMQAKDVDQAISAFEQAQKLDSNNPTLQTQLALARSAVDSLEKTVADLQRISAADKGTFADLALVNLLLKHKEYSRALAAVDSLATKLPRSPVPAHLRGMVRVQQGDLVKAREAFEDALRLKPNYYAAVESLAAVDVAQNRPQHAVDRYRALLKTDEKNVPAMVALAKLLSGSPASIKEAAGLAKNAISLDPARPDAHATLIRVLVASNDLPAALAAAQHALSVHPENTELLDLAGRTQIASGDTNQAISTYGKLVNVEPKSASALVRLAGAYLAAKNNAVADQTLRKALSISPNFLPAQQALVSLAQTSRQFAEASKIAREVIHQRPKETVGYMMAGAVETSRRNWVGAAAIYREGLLAVPDTKLAAALYTTLHNARRPQEAERFAQTWRTEQPADLEFVAFLGDGALARRQYAAAESHFRTIIATDANNVVALNNLAFSIAAQNKSGGVELARRAVALKPGDAGLLDTLASALAVEGDAAQAIDVQKQAIKAAPRDNGLRFHLAVHYVKAGRPNEARTELLELAKLGEELPVHAQVQQLLASLR